MRGKSALLGVGVVCALALTALLRVWGPAGPPRLVLVIVVDQMRYDFLTRFRDLYTGGFRTLLEEGAVFTNASFRHALTLTAPGHAVVATGLHPAQSGVTANTWYDPTVKKPVNSVADGREEPLGGPGRAASPRALFADTLGDRLKERNRASRVVGISVKDRAAILLAGRRADAAYWYSSRCGCFITSTYYREASPPWLVAFNEAKPADQYRGKPWTRLLDNPALYEERARADGFPTERDGERIFFPHEIEAQPPEPLFYSQVANSPYGDELVLEAALAAMKAHELGADETPDLLAISFSATDYVGHSYGPFSQEAMDNHLRLDRLLGRLLEKVDEAVGLERTAVVLTADHGAAPVVEEAQKLGLPAKRLPAKALPEGGSSASSSCPW